MANCILTINGGSSSIRFAVFENTGHLSRLVAGKIDRIGLPDCRLEVTNIQSGNSTQHALSAPDHRVAIACLTTQLSQQLAASQIVAIGHRIVHGGSTYSQPQRVTQRMVDDLRLLIPLDLAHLPAEIALIEACQQQFPDALQVACFDTAFSHDLPARSRLLPVPRQFTADGVRRYGFHGLSYMYLMEALRRRDPAVSNGRLILAHLGSGSSMAAVLDGKCIDISMSFTPTAGLVMGTRTGDLDPSFVTYLMRVKGLNADQIDDVLTKQSGLRGLSGVSSDIRDLLNCEATNSDAAEAVEIYCYQARKWIGSFAAALGGLDGLVFAGGIGENSPIIRARICHGLEFLGVQLAAEANLKQQPLISRADSPVKIHVIKTDEEAVIATAVRRELGGMI